MTEVGAAFVVSLNDSRAFARLSGDFNPIHLDPIASRRSLYGSTVAHGVHVVMAALDALARATGPKHLKAIKARFHQPVRHGDEVTFVIDATQGPTAKVSAESARGIAQRIAVTLEPPRTGQPATLQDNPPFEPREPRALTPAGAAAVVGTFPFGANAALLSALFPDAALAFQHDALALLLGSTGIVGMEAPGARSLFLGLNLNFDEHRLEGAAIEFDAKRFDERFLNLDLFVRSPGGSGVVETAFRPAPVQQAPAEVLLPLLAGDEFAGRRALIVGGSRGLGEVATKLLALGGADVTLTYATGAADAERVRRELLQAGRSVDVLQWDATSGQAPERTLGPLSDLGYFASPAIEVNRSGRFDAALFRRFAETFVVGMMRAAALFPVGSGGRILVPSTAFLDTRPEGLGEYVAAKAAAEEAAAYLGLRKDGPRCQVVRLPQMATDQTAAVRGLSSEAVAPTILSALRNYPH